jgi:hypothetical protein
MMRRILVRGADAQEFVKRAGEQESGGYDNYYSCTVEGVKYEIGRPLADLGYASIDTELRYASALILTAMSADTDETKYIADTVRTVSLAAPRLPIYVVSLAFRPLNTCTPEKLEYLLAEVIQTDSEFCELRVMTDDKTDINSLVKAIHVRISPTIPTLRTDQCVSQTSSSASSLRTVSSGNTSLNGTPRSPNVTPHSRDGTPHRRSPLSGDTPPRKASPRTPDETPRKVSPRTPTDGTPPLKISPRTLDDEREKHQSCTTQ